MKQMVLVPYSQVIETVPPSQPKEPLTLQTPLQAKTSQLDAQINHILQENLTDDEKAKRYLQTLHGYLRFHKALTDMQERPLNVKLAENLPVAPEQPEGSMEYRSPPQLTPHTPVRKKKNKKRRLTAWSSF